MIALSYVESVWWTMFGTGVALVTIAFLGSIGETGRMLVATLVAFAAFVAGVAAIVWWAS